MGPRRIQNHLAVLILRKRAEKSAGWSCHRPCPLLPCRHRAAALFDSDLPPAEPLTFGAACWLSTAPGRMARVPGSPVGSRRGSLSAFCPVMGAGDEALGA
jgi:hypothetical protein